jgi:tetratricopeptide (TPR) repeat protein
MQKEDIRKTFEAFNNYMSGNRIKDAIEILELTEPGSAEFSDEISRINTTYHNLAKYTVMGVQDPQRSKIYSDIELSLYELSDRIRHRLLESNSIRQLSAKLEPEQHALQLREQIRELYENYSFDTEVKAAFFGTVTQEAKDTESGFRKKQLINMLFGWLWFGGKLNENDKELVLNILKSSRFQWHEKSLIVSAVTMGLINCFDVHRFEILLDAYERNEDQVAQRAFTGLLLGLFYYDHRLYLYPQIVNRLRAKQGDESLELDAKTVIFQLFRAKDTEKVTKKFREEIMPDIIKFAPGLEDKLGLNQIIKDDPAEDKNPKWKMLFEDNPDLIGKLEEITRMQLEGMDVFMSTFANLKHFPFFSELVNWFTPFHTGHEAVEVVLEKEEPRFRDVFIDGLNRSHYMCNSDKFSFCMSLGSMPQQQKEMMLQMFAAEVEGMKEMEKEEDILDARKKTNSIYTQYIQDLYRFYKIYPNRQELDDIFRLRFNFHDKSFMRHILSGEKSWRSFADFYFQREFFVEALEIYQMMHEAGDNSQEVFEKIAYCFEKTGKTDKALVYYRKAELFDQNRAWNLRKIARCQWMLREHEAAIASYKEAEVLEPENLHLQITIGNCYLSIKDYKQALNYYYKVELASPDNQRVMRPIAWCLFVTGKMEEARHYYDKLMEADPNKYDFMNLGHLLLCKGEKLKAMDCYLQSLRQKDNSIQQFMAGFNDDRQYLLKHGVDHEELPVLVDYLKYLYEQRTEK